MGLPDSGRSLPRMKRIINGGTSVMASKDENPTARVLVHASGRNIRPSCASSKNTGKKETTMIKSEKKIAGATDLGRLRTRMVGFRQMPIAVFNHGDGGIHQDADGQRQAA